MTTLHDFRMKTLDGGETNFADLDGKVALVVNVASKCGLTPQYEGLQKLHEKYEGLAVLGFPCNQFGGQEPGSPEDIQSFCSTSYGVSFPMMAKIEVNGTGAHELYQWLKREETEPQPAGDITWNFEKFLVGKDGQVLARFSPKVAPDAPELVGAIEKALG
ncbi:MAG: glutathione peroxidase [Sandaracinaceae bacterium]